jgi:hypothetical protein
MGTIVGCKADPNGLLDRAYSLWPSSFQLSVPSLQLSHWKCHSLRGTAFDGPLHQLARSVYVPIPLHAFNRWIPNELMHLQSQARRHIVRNHPLCQFPRIQQAVRSIAGPGRLFAESGRE